jgi:alpha-1,6-mannosyltransferase
MRRIYVPRFDYHVANSEYTAEEIRLALNGRPQEMVHVCPMGVDTSGLRPGRRRDSLRRELLARCHASPRARLLLYAGRLAPEKNLSLLSETMGLLVPDAEEYHLLVAGSGPREADFRRECETLAPSRVTFLGQVADREALGDLYANCDVFIHPNPREPFGIAPLEAMASGLPLVAPASGGVLSYANRLNAWLAEPQPEVFAAAVGEVFCNPAARQRRVESALLTAQHFAWPEVASRFFRLYDQMHACFRTGRVRNQPAPALPFAADSLAG